MLKNSNKVNATRVLIRELHAEFAEKIRAHYKGLGIDDRLLRFGMYASDETIDKYVNKIDYSRDALFGVFDSNLNLIACAHLCYPTSNSPINSTAEFGVSVSVGGREKGIGSALFNRAAMHARNTNIQVLYVHCLSRNKVMMHIAKKAGMSIEYSFGEADAYLKLLPSTNSSILAEAVQAQVADIDYEIKKKIRHSKSLLSNLFLLKTSK